MLQKQINFQKFINFLIFLFPIGSVTLRHWISSIFVLLCLLSIGCLFVQRKNAIRDLHVHEKRLLLFLLAHFTIFFITALVNDPMSQSKWHMGVEIRFLIAIPLYLMIRQIPDAYKPLLWGCALGLVVTVGQAIYETQYLHIRYTEGIYGPLFTGPFTLLIALFLAPGALILVKNVPLRLVLWLISISSLYVIINNGSRGSYVALLLVPLLMVIYASEGWKRITHIILILIVAMSFSKTFEHELRRFPRAWADIVIYFTTEDKNSIKNLGSAGTRLEMLRSLKYFASDHALLGVGAGNYNKAIKNYIDQELVNPAIGNHSHPHNAFANAFMLKGIFGLLVTLALIFYPIYVFLWCKDTNSNVAIFGLIHMTSIFIHSMNEAATFNKGNFVATQLIFLFCFYSCHLKSNMTKDSFNLPAK